MFSAAVGAAAGASVGGGVLGLSSVLIGRAIGATLGRAIDQRMLGSGSEAVETGRVDRFRLTGASEGAPVARLYGRMRLGGQVIWASNFRETRIAQRRRQGRTPKPKVTEYSYTVSLAMALCEGEISGIGRIWADGQEIDAVRDGRCASIPATRTQLAGSGDRGGRGRRGWCRPIAASPMW